MGSLLDRVGEATSRHVRAGRGREGVLSKFLSCSVGLSFANLEESFKFIPQASGRAVSANCVLWRLLRGHCIVLVSSQTELP